MKSKKNTSQKSIPNFGTTLDSGIPREIPDSVKTKKALAYNQNQLAVERTEFSKYRTDLAFTNSKLAIEQTHLAYLRTIVSLIGSGATIFKALPLLGISQTFTNFLTAFLFIFAAYFIYKDLATYPKMKRHIAELEQQANELATQTESLVFKVKDDVL
ncbi:MAG: hypothetical protein IJP29_08480 [Lachnospiraceae bacterium]|nr:hypothetical protein [Lachnospiraceae bacterium]